MADTRVTGRATADAGVANKLIDNRGTSDTQRGLPDAGGPPDAGVPSAAAPPGATKTARTQEPTLREAQAKNLTLPPRNLVYMDPRDFGLKTAAQRRDWYLAKLGAFENQLRESAEDHQIPIRLLAAVILNELANIDLRDIAQDAALVLSGSLGIAQIQVDTVIRDDLFPNMRQNEIDAAYNEYLQATAHNRELLNILAQLSKAETGRRMAIRKRLRVPQHAIDAAAREIRQLLWLMVANLDKPWQTSFEFKWRGYRLASPELLYGEIGAKVWCRSTDEVAQGGDFAAVRGKEGKDPQREREKNLAYLVAAAYNSPDVIRTATLSRYVGARTHGQNACAIASDLYDFGLFSR